MTQFRDGYLSSSCGAGVRHRVGRSQAVGLLRLAGLRLSVCLRSAAYWMGTGGVVGSSLTGCILLPLDDVVETREGVEVDRDEVPSDSDEAPSDGGAEEPSDAVQPSDAVETDGEPIDGSVKEAATDADDELTDESEAEVMADAGDAPSDGEPTPTDFETDPMDCDCGARECGDDGCGGSCGDCSPGEGCEMGQCVEQLTCDSQTVVMVNDIPTRSLYSDYCGQYVAADTVIYVEPVADSSAYITNLEPLAVDIDFGASVTFEYFCCVLDGASCFNSHVCNLGDLSFNCACETATRQFTVEANVCEDNVGTLLCP